MKRFIFYVVVLIFAVWLGLLILHQPAYVLLVLKNYTVQMPAWFVVVSFLLIYVLLYLLSALWRGFARVGKRVNRWGEQRHKQRAIKYTNRGLIQLAQGHWKQAENYLRKGANDYVTPLVNYLALAEAAQAQGQYDKRDNYLHKAHDVEPEATVAIGITQAKLQLRYKQYEQSLATLQHLRDIVPRHLLVLQLLKKIYYHLQDWQSLSQLLPVLRHSRAYSDKELISLTQTTYTELLRHTNTLSGLNHLWSGLSSIEKQDLTLVTMYSQRLLAIGEHQILENFLKQYLKQHWYSSLLAIYAAANVDDKKQLTQLQHWLKKHPQDAALFNALAVLYQRNQRWEKARDCYEKSLALAPGVEQFIALAKLCEYSGDVEKAQQYYKQGLLYVDSVGAFPS